VPIPETILPELKAQIEFVGRLHDEDLAARYDGVVIVPVWRERAALSWSAAFPYCRTSRRFSASASKLLRKGLMSRPPRRV
jgi:hypothetical protein